MNDLAERLYVYCIVSKDGKLPSDLVGIDSERPRLERLAGDGFEVVFSRCIESEFAVSRKHLMAHQAIMQDLLDRGRTVLPVRFNTITDPGLEKALDTLRRRVLGHRKEEVDELIKRMRGNVEVGVKVLWADMPTVFSELVKERPELRSVHSKAQQRGGRLNRETVVEAGERVKEGLGQKKKKEAKAILQRLGELCVERKEAETFGDPMVLNASFLVQSPDGIVRLSEESEAIESEGKGRLRVRSSGPLPPSSFVDLVIELREASR